MSDITIIMPSYNKEKYIAQALDSVFAQETSYDYHVVVADDCSNDRLILLKLKKLETFYKENQKIIDKHIIINFKPKYKVLFYIYKNCIKSYQGKELCTNAKYKRYNTGI